MGILIGYNLFQGGYPPFRGYTVYAYTLKIDYLTISPIERIIEGVNLIDIPFNDVGLTDFQKYGKCVPHGH